MALSEKEPNKHFYNSVGLEMKSKKYDDMVFRFVTFDEATNGIKDYRDCYKLNVVVHLIEKLAALEWFEIDVSA